MMEKRKIVGKVNRMCRGRREGKKMKMRQTQRRRDRQRGRVIMYGKKRMRKSEKVRGVRSGILSDKRKVTRKRMRY